VPFETDESGDRPDLASTEGGYEAVELEDQLTRSTAKLRQRDQRITMALARGFSAREIASVLRVSPSIVSVALRRVRTTVRWT
jgi:DNA-binding NarL/FixJ family response regulator